MKQNLKKVKHQWPPKNRFHIKRSSWSSFDSTNSLKKKIISKKFDFNSHAEKAEKGRFKKKTPAKGTKKALRPLKSNKKPTKRLKNTTKKTINKLKFDRKIFNFKVFALINMEFLSIGISVYFIFKNILDFSIKHLVYILKEPIFRKELLFLCIYGVLQSIFLLICLACPKQKRYTNILYCICISNQFLMLVSFGSFQFSNYKTIWDLQYVLKNYFVPEIIKYIFEVYFLGLCCLFKYLKLFGKI
jgi:hypothetical protein